MPAWLSSHKHVHQIRESNFTRALVNSLLILFMYNSRKNLGKELSQDLKKSSVHFVGARNKESHLPLSLRMLLQGSHNQRLVHTLMAPSAVSLPRPLLVLCIQPPVGWPPVNAQRASRLLCTNLLVAISLKTDIPHFRQ